MNVMIALDGVLRSHTGAPIVEGIALYRALSEHRVFLATSDSAVSAETWLKLEKLAAHQMLLTEEVSQRDQDVRAGQLRHCTGIGSRIDILIDPSPSRCANAMALGITSLLFAAPKYARPEFRPDRQQGMRPWHEISDELDAQALAEAEDVRVP